MRNPKYLNLRKLLLVCAMPFLFLACKTIEPVSVTEVKNVTLSSITTKKVEMEFSMQIKNPNSFGFYIYKSAIDVKLNKTPMGKAELKQKVFIKANSEDTYTFEVKSNLPGTLEGATSILSVALKRNATIELHGKIKAGRFIVRKNFPIDFKRDVSLDTP
jgi:LEA14-like dessication related protein